MTHRILTLTAALLFASTHVSADIIAQGLELKPASSSELTLERIDSASEDMLTLRVGAEGAQNVKGFGFVLNFDADRFEYVGSEETFDSLISPNGRDALLVHKNHEDGKVAVGAVQIDGSSGSGKGAWSI